MTPGAIFTNRLLMNIEVTGDTICFNRGKFKRSMALTTINNTVLTFKYKTGCVMIKKYGVRVDNPTVCGVTCITTDFKRCAMGRLCMYNEWYKHKKNMTQSPFYQPHLFLLINP